MAAPAPQPFLASQPQYILAHDSKHPPDISYTPVIIVLFVITFLSIASCIWGRIHSRGSDNEDSYDLEKGLGTMKTDAAKLKNKDVVISTIGPNMMATSKCELHGNMINPKKLLSAKTTASVTLKNPGLRRCEVHGIYLPRNTKESDNSLSQKKESDNSGANDEEQASNNLN